jgi:3-hydroxyacyl-[acyl-carrier-protein] dehydratase
MLLNTDQVKAFLPHRDPFLFIDSVVEAQAGENAPSEITNLKDLLDCKVHALYETKADHPIFAGHFPNHPILPGVVQVEMMAQASSFIITLVKDFNENTKLDTALVSVSNAKFRKPIYPDMKLDIKTTCTKVRGPMVADVCEIYHNGELMSQAEVMATIKLV